MIEMNVDHSPLWGDRRHQGAPRTHEEIVALAYGQAMTIAQRGMRRAEAQRDQRRRTTGRCYVMFCSLQFDQ